MITGAEENPGRMQRTEANGSANITAYVSLKLLSS